MTPVHDERPGIHPRLGRFDEILVICLARPSCVNRG